MKRITFWNGNKSAARKGYEEEVLRRCLNVLDTKQTYSLDIDNTDYPKAEDESNIFLNGCDVLVTVAGNQKFALRDKLVIDLPICNGLLGHRLLIVNKGAEDKFRQVSTLEQLRKMTVGVPATWADADLFRKSQFSVYEHGLLEDIFQLLRDRLIDFTTLGANEVETTFQHYSAAAQNLAIESSLLIYYPLPLVFYVNPNQPELAQRLQAGLSELVTHGELQTIFNTYHAGIVERLALPTRNLLTLNNPYLPASLKHYRPTLW